MTTAVHIVDVTQVGVNCTSARPVRYPPRRAARARALACHAAAATTVTATRAGAVPVSVPLVGAIRALVPTAPSRSRRLVTGAEVRGFPTGTAQPLRPGATPVART